MLIVELKSCSILSMRIGIFVRIEKMKFVLVFRLVLVYSPPSSIAHPPRLAVGKVGLCGFDFFLYPDCTVMRSIFLLIC